MCVDDSPGRGILRATAAKRLRAIGEKWKDKDEREGNLPIPIGGVVTVAIDRVDRGHNNAKRLPGVVVDMMVVEERRFYTVACLGGVLKTKYLRNDLIYEVNVTQDAYDLEDVFTNWKLLKVSIH